MSEYVIKGERMRAYLYNLGFDYRQVPDQTHKQEVVWLFQKSDLLIEALAFYSKVKNAMIHEKL